MWYTNCYRRNLVDMHIADWDESFLSSFSPEDYVNNLKVGKIQNAMIYLQSHVGLCYYPTKSGVMHKALISREDLIKRTVDLCHANGISVTGYYSLDFNTVEHDRHPEWRMLQENGKSCRENGTVGTINPGSPDIRYGLCCPNNMDYRKFVFGQIDEMLEYFEVDGMFFDMPFWPHTCHCEKCKKRFIDETGTNLPISEPPSASPEHLILMQRKYAWMGEWTQAITDYVKAKNKDISVEYNYAGGIDGNSDRSVGYEVNAASDYVGGDLYGGIYNHSLACKFYKNITRNAPFEYMFSRCKPELSSHTLTKTEDEMLREVMLTAAHHGATLVIDAIDPVGTQDKRVYERIGKIFGKQAEYESYFKGEMAEDIAIYYSLRGRFGSNVYGFDSKLGCMGASRALIESHKPFGVTGSFYELTKYKALILPMVSGEENDEERILKYVYDGGSIYLSGACAPALVEALTGGKIIGYTDVINTYIAPKAENEPLFIGFNEKFPLPIDACLPKLDNAQNGCVLATVTLPYTKRTECKFASIHSNPPGIKTELPALIEGSYGKGKFIWSAAPIEAIELDEYREIFVNLINRLTEGLEPTFKTEAESTVEITVFNDGDISYVNVVDLTEKTKLKNVEPFKISIKGTAKQITKLPDNENVDFEVKDGYTTFTTDIMHVFDMYKIIK